MKYCSVCGEPMLDNNIQNIVPTGKSEKICDTCQKNFQKLKNHNVTEICEAVEYFELISKKSIENKNTKK